MTHEAKLTGVRIVGAAVLGALFVLSAALVSAQESTITFPVSELGNCASKSECHAYCDNLANIKKCVAFAESHGLMSAEEARQAREFERLGGKGPGGCTSKDSCESFCEKPGNMRQCLDFAKKSGMMSAEELQEAEKVAAYLDKGGTMPGGCQGRACQAYCEDESHREACIAFALEHDLMSAEDKLRMEQGKEQAKQALEKAPPKVLECIEARIGAERLKAIRDGSGFIDRKLGEILPACFREVMGEGPQRGPFGPGSEATECMRKVFGEDFEDKMRKGELDPGARDDEIRECMIRERGEGFLDDKGQWERPQSGEMPREGERGRPPEDMRFGPREGGDRESIEAEMRARYGEEFDSRRREMEAKMRAEIEAQMRSGEFDMSKLPPDFRPEGAFPPPEAYNRPPDGSMPPPGANKYSLEGVMPPPEGVYAPAQYVPSATDPVPATSDESVSMGSQFVANVITIFQSLLGGR